MCCDFRSIQRVQHSRLFHPTHLDGVLRRYCRWAVEFMQPLAISRSCCLDQSVSRPWSFDERVALRHAKFLANQKARASVARNSPSLRGKRGQFHHILSATAGDLNLIRRK